MTDDAAPIERYLSAEIHQAEGALSARLEIDIQEAADLLRGIARDAGRPLDAVARQVLAERQLVDGPAARDDGCGASSRQGGVPDHD